MRIVAASILVSVIAFAVWLWGFGGADVIGRWAVEAQREAQNGMAASLRRLRSGDTGALVTLWAVCLTYGFVHAAGPGHGKLVIGAYGIGVRATARRMAGLAVASSLAQALVAIILVTALVLILGWGRAQLTELADKGLAPFSYGMIVLLGVWIAWRGMRKLWRRRQDHTHDHDHHHHHDHSHDGDGVCADCGHVHGPTAEQAASVTGWRDTFALIAVIAARPCTGAIFLLILSYALDIYWVGVIGALVMGLGTAAFTGLVALTAVTARESALAQVASSRSTAWLLALAEAGAGLLIVAVAGQLLLRVL